MGGWFDIPIGGGCGAFRGGLAVTGGTLGELMFLELETSLSSIMHYFQLASYFCLDFRGL